MQLYHSQGVVVDTELTKAMPVKAEQGQSLPAALQKPCCTGVGTSELHFTRKVWLLLQDAVVMLLGTIMLAVATGSTTNGWVIMYAISQLVFGFGVGGKP